MASAFASSPPASAPVIVRSAAALRSLLHDWRTEGARVALVPTMGALHEGHLSLVRQAQAEADRVVVSVFVNPTQFGPAEDFAAYPRREAADAAALAGVGAQAMYAPPVADMYPEGFATTVTVAGVTEGLCGGHRPGHFQGVATVVTKLLLRALADVAVFGEKDYQQLMVIRRLARDLDIPTRILGAPTVREADGLALSSRNAYLSAEDRARAPALYRVLTETATRLRSGSPGDVAEDLATGTAALLAAGFRTVDYLELRSAATLAPLTTADQVAALPVGGARLLAAAHLGQTRLIDNIPV